MGPEEWRQAQAAFGWARVLSPRDGSLLARQLTADGHVRRLAAQRTRPSSSAMAQGAVARFRDAAAADPNAFDPYVGMAMTQLYTLADVDGAIQSLEAAVKRGYTVTRRDTALLGDATLRRGLLGRKRAALLTGDQRQSALEKAKADFESCLSSFEQIVEFGNAAKHLETCKAQLRQVSEQLDSGRRVLAMRVARRRRRCSARHAAAHPRAQHRAARAGRRVDHRALRNGADLRREGWRPPTSAPDGVIPLDGLKSPADLEPALTMFESAARAAVRGARIVSTGRRAGPPPRSHRRAQ